MGKCKETAGVLFPHPCSRESSLRCGKCEKAICDLHSRQLHGGPVCIGCYKQHAPRDTNDPFLMSGIYFSDYDTATVGVAAVGAAGLYTAMTSSENLEDNFESDFDGT